MAIIYFLTKVLRFFRNKDVVLSLLVKDDWIKNGKTSTHYISRIEFIEDGKFIDVTIVKRGISVDRLRFTIEHAQNIGFINVDALESYC